MPTLLYRDPSSGSYLPVAGGVTDSAMLARYLERTAATGLLTRDNTAGHARGSFTATSVATATVVTLTLATPASLYQVTQSTNTLTINKAGWWAVTFYAQFSAATTTYAQRMYFDICHNPGTEALYRTAFANASEGYASGTALFKAALTNTFYFKCYQNTGATVTVNGHYRAKFLMAQGTAPPL